MQIHVGLPSRGRPLDMVASAVSLFRLASGAHDLKLTILTDADDSDSVLMSRELWKALPGTRCDNSDRKMGLGELHNHAASMTARDAAFMLWSDRLQVITPGWDQALALACMSNPKRVLWLDSVHLTGAGQFILPPAWRAAQGAPTPGIFPFWFEDTVLEELDAFVHGLPRVSIAAHAAGARKLPTTRLRDLPFWIDLFAATRMGRIDASRLIADRLGVHWQNRPDVLAVFEARDRSFHERAAMLEQQFGDPGPPDETYLAAKARAEAIMAGMRP